MRFKLKNFNLSKFNDFDDIYINRKYKFIIIKNFDFNKYDKSLFWVNQMDEIRENYRIYKNYRIIINE